MTYNKNRTLSTKFSVLRKGLEGKNRSTLQLTIYKRIAALRGRSAQGIPQQELLPTHKICQGDNVHRTPGVGNESSDENMEQVLLLGKRMIPRLVIEKRDF